MEKLARDPKTSGADQCFGWCCEVLSRISTLERWKHKREEYDEYNGNEMIQLTRDKCQKEHFDITTKKK